MFTPLEIFQILVGIGWIVFFIIFITPNPINKKFGVSPYFVLLLLQFGIAIAQLIN
jgi:hypothetical protein